MTKILVTTIRLTHILTLIFVLLGWIANSPKGLLVHIMVVPLVVVQWQLNNGTCLLTNLEHWLRGSQQSSQAQQGAFIKALLGFCFNPLPRDESIKTFIYTILTLSWITSFVKYLGLF